MPDFYPGDLPVPEGLETADFILQPLTPLHVKLDHAALMESKSMLRLWSGSTWPSDDFTEADNMVDLKWHDEEHRKRVAFTYTVLNPEEDRCLGCVYIKPLLELFRREKASIDMLKTIGDFETVVFFWVTQPMLGKKLDYHLLTALRNWFTQDWAFKRVLFHTRSTNSQQQGLFTRLAMQLIYTFDTTPGSSQHQLWE